jgi:general secretion pathway protein B
MSYILDALKKAEHQREIGHVPGIGSDHGTNAAGGVAGRWVWILLAVLLINAVLLAVALWPESASNSRPVSAPGPADNPSLPRASVPLAPAAAPDVRLVQRPGPPRQPMVSVEVPDEVSSPPARLIPLPPLPSTPEPPQQDAVGTSEYAEPVAGEPGLANLPPPPRAAIATARDDNLPVWPQVSGQLLGEINSPLHLDVHVYSDQPSERFVLINMQKYNEGGRLQEGPVVDAITPDGVILSFRGQRFRMDSQ